MVEPDSANYDERPAILQSILETAVDAIITIDSTGRIRQANPAVEAMLGYAVEELIGENISKLMPADIAEQHDGYLKAYLQTGVAQIIGIGREVRALHKQGQLIDVDLAVSEIRIGDQRLFTGILRDMTSRIAAEDSARRERRFANNLVEMASVAVVVLDQQGRIARINPFLEKLSGYQQTEVLGKSWYDIFLLPEDRERQQELSQRIVGGEKVGSDIHSIRTRSGETRVLTWSKVVLHDADDVRDGILFIGNDITELKRAEQQLMAQVRLAAIGEMVTGLAHESRNALQRARAYLDVLELDASHETRNMIVQTQAAIDELQRLYEEVRGYAAPIRLELGNCNIEHLCEQVWQQLESSWRDRKLRLQFQSSQPDLRWKCDKGRLQQVIRNIFENAIAVSPEHGEVLVTCELTEANQHNLLHESKVHEQPTDQHNLRLSIRDEGPGLNDEQAANIFTPFYTTKTRGTGLGMAIAKRIVDAHEGAITLGDRTHPGAEIIITLPHPT